MNEKTIPTLRKEFISNTNSLRHFFHEVHKWRVWTKSNDTSAHFPLFYGTNAINQGTRIMVADKNDDYFCISALFSKICQFVACTLLYGPTVSEKTQESLGNNGFFEMAKRKFALRNASYLVLYLFTQHVNTCE